MILNKEKSNKNHKAGFNPALYFYSFNFDRFSAFFGIFNHRFCTAAFPIPKANYIVTIFCHLFVSFRTCAAPVFAPIGRVTLYFKSIFLCIQFPKRISAVCPTRDYNYCVFLSYVGNTVINIFLCFLVVTIISATWLWFGNRYICNGKLSIWWCIFGSNKYGL